MTKAKDYTKVCWSCGQETMQPERTVYRCSKCGATWCGIPEPGHPALAPTADTYGIERHARPWGAPD